MVFYIIGQVESHHSTHCHHDIFAYEKDVLGDFPTQSADAFRLDRQGHSVVSQERHRPQFRVRSRVDAVANTQGRWRRGWGDRSRNSHISLIFIFTLNLLLNLSSFPDYSFWTIRPSFSSV